MTVRSLLTNNKFGTGPKSYLHALSELEKQKLDASALRDVLSSLCSDESRSRYPNIFRLAAIFYISSVYLKEGPPSLFWERVAELDKDGGVFFNGRPDTLSNTQYPYEILLPFGLSLNTSNDYFSENEFRTDLNTADRSLIRFFSKIGSGSFSSGGGWIYSLARSAREIYDNTLTHAFFATRAPLSYINSDEPRRNRSNFWFFGFRRFPFSPTSEYFLGLPQIDEYLDSLERRVRYFIAVNITDDGPGVLRYYNLCTMPHRPIRKIGQLIDKKLSSTDLAGAGWGFSNVIMELEADRGYFNIDSYGDQFSAFYNRESGVMTEDRKSPTIYAGTTVDILIPILG